MTTMLQRDSSTVWKHVWREKSMTKKKRQARRLFVTDTIFSMNSLLLQLVALFMEQPLLDWAWKFKAAHCALCVWKTRVKCWIISHDKRQADLFPSCSLVGTCQRLSQLSAPRLRLYSLTWECFIRLWLILLIRTISESMTNYLVMIHQEKT